MEEKAERARSADPRPALARRAGAWTRRVRPGPGLQRRAEPRPPPLPPRPRPRLRPLLKAVITLCPEQGPASPVPESGRRQALRARLPLRSSERAEGGRAARACLGLEGDRLRPSGARTPDTPLLHT